MPRIKLLTDYTKYFDVPTFAHKVTIYVNSATVVCCGALLASSSTVLEEKIINGEEDILLERFCFDGCENAVKSCLAALYGDDIDINFKNISIVLKFASFYKVHPLYRLGLQWIEKEMVPKMLFHVENVLNCLEDLEYRNELSKVIGKYISANIDEVCEEVTQLMVYVNTEISENIITEIVRLKSFHAGQILSDWCMKSEKNIIFIFENEDRFNMRSIFPDTELFQSFIKVLMSKVDALGMDGMKQIVDLQNSYYTHALQNSNNMYSDIFLRSRVWQSYSFTDISDLSQNDAISVASSSIALEDSNNNYDIKLTKLHEIKTLTYLPYQDLLRTKFTGISPYHYIELCAQWIESRKPEIDLFDVIWSSFATDKVSKEFMGCIRSKLTSLNYTIYYPEISVPSSISTAKLKFDVDLEDPFCYSGEETSDPIELTFKNEENYEYTVTVCFFSSAPLVRVQRVKMKPRIVSSFIKVCHIYFRMVSSRGNSRFVSIMSNDEDEFEDALTSRKRCYICLDYYMPARVAM